MMPASRTPIGYFGAKTIMSADIVARMLPHQGYVEPYAGSLAVLLAKPTCELEVINDLDGRLMTFWRVLRDRPGELYHMAECTPPSRQLTKESAALDADDELRLAHQVWVALSQGRSRALDGNGGWRGKYQIDASTTLSEDMRKFRDRLMPAARRLRDVQLENRDALDIIADYGDEPRTLFYVDPPYLGSTRSAGGYGFDAPDVEHHRALAERLHAVRGPVILSGYPSELYDELFGDWYCMLVGATSQNALPGKQRRIEALWANYDIDSGTLW